MVIGGARPHQPRPAREAGRRRRPPGLAGAAALAAVLLGAACAAAAADALSVLRADGVRVQFTVEHAVDADARRRGLMHRAALPAGHGMLFDFGTQGRIRMWMKDTLIPLDMLFIDERGAIVGIGAGIPHSTALVDGGTAARYVLEINGGESARLGLAPGDRVLVPALRTSAARTPDRR